MKRKFTERVLQPLRRCLASLAVRHMEVKPPLSCYTDLLSRIKKVVVVLFSKTGEGGTYPFTYSLWKQSHIQRAMTIKMINTCAFFIS